MFFFIPLIISWVNVIKESFLNVIRIFSCINSSLYKYILSLFSLIWLKNNFDDEFNVN